MGDEILHETEREKDLRVYIMPNLSPEVHITIITSAAYARLANIRTTIRNLRKESFRILYTTYEKPILEYEALAWSPYLIKHKTMLEKVQIYANRLVPELRGMSSWEKLREMHVTLLEDRRARGDMITTYKNSKRN
ncbi:uncharacterized protein [Procambarus clarkii]|uniref:uncharacterized protein n=1 Tax=Procambarus clarkii TaxID=6728 RepID=UPI00374456E6